MTTIRTQHELSGLILNRADNELDRIEQAAEQAMKEFAQHTNTYRKAKYLFLALRAVKEVNPEGFSVAAEYTRNNPITL